MDGQHRRHRPGGERRPCHRNRPVRRALPEVQRDLEWQRRRKHLLPERTAYDPPTQAAYQHDGVLGYAAFKVADNVQSFQGYGMGSYIFTNVNPDIHVSHAFEVPVTPGVQMHDLLTINLSGPGTIDHVINDTGGPVSSANKDVASQVVSYPTG